MSLILRFVVVLMLTEPQPDPHAVTMGVSYSAPTLKSHLKMAVQRLMMHRNKKTNQISVDSKAVAILLQQGKDESARIRCEAILHEKNLCIAYEMLQLMCELLGARVALVTASKECPSDLEEAISSVIYCSGRIEIPELKFIVQQYAAKYSSEWCTTHVDNASGKVHPRIVEKLAIIAPPFDVLLGMMQDIAATYNVEWKPDIQALEAGITDHSNPEKLGSIAKIGASPTAAAPTVAAQAPAAAAAASAAAAPAAKPQGNNVPAPVAGAASVGGYPVASAAGSGKPVAMNPDGTPSPYPGTLNLILHRGRNFVNLASQSDPHDLYVVITNLMSKVRWKSEADPTGGSEPIWFENPRLPGAVSHFPLSIADAFQQVQIEVFQANTGLKLHADRLLGSTVMYADSLRKNPGLQWYAVYNSNMEAGYLLLGTQFLPLNAVVLSQEELNNQRAWIEQEQQHAAAQQQQSPSSMAPVMQFLPPGQILMQPMQPMQPMQKQQFGGPGGPDFAHPQQQYAMQPQQQQLQQSPAEMNYPSQPQRYQAPGAGAGAGAGSINRSADNSLSDRLKGGQLGGLWSQPPESPPHKLGASLSDIAKPRPVPQIPASYDDKHVASPHDVALPDAGYQAMGADDAEPGSGTHKEQVERERAAHQKRLWEAQREERKQAHVQSVEDRCASEDPFEYSEFPPVPAHKAGRGSASKAAAAAAGSPLAEPLVPAAASASVEADDPDADLEARFRRLQ